MANIKMKTFKQHLFEKQILNESLSNELMYLKRYLTMTEDQKDINRGIDNPWFIDDFLSAQDYDVGDEFYELEDYEKIDWLQSNDEEKLIEYGRYVFDQRGYEESSERELYDQVSYEGFIRNEWLVHFSNNASSIWRSQKFEYGIEYHDYQRLGLSTHFGDEAKQYGGFNFAYKLADVNRYGFNGFSSHGPKYGSEAILFKGDGLNIYHYGDQEPQVIFDGKTTRPPLIYIQEEYGDWLINSNRHYGKLIRFDDIERIGDWVDINYEQYRKHLEPK